WTLTPISLVRLARALAVACARSRLKLPESRAQPVEAIPPTTIGAITQSGRLAAASAGLPAQPLNRAGVTVERLNRVGKRCMVAPEPGCWRCGRKIVKRPVRGGGFVSAAGGRAPRPGGGITRSVTSLPAELAAIRVRSWVTPAG